MNSKLNLNLKIFLLKSNTPNFFIKKTDVRAWLNLPKNFELSLSQAPPFLQLADCDLRRAAAGGGTIALVLCFVQPRLCKRPVRLCTRWHGFCDCQLHCEPVRR